MRSRIVNLLDHKKYLFVFIFSLFSMTLLIAWWTVFLYRSVEDSYKLKLDSVRDSAQSYALYYGIRSDGSPKAGTVTRDKRLEISFSESAPGPFSFELLPRWRRYWMVPKRAFLNELERDYKSKKLMVIGEGAFLLIPLLISVFMIFRLHRLERRSTRELYELWSRASHEIKTPITGLRVFLETLKRGDLDKEELDNLIQLALRQVDRQQQMSENMLMGQRLETGMLGIEMETIDLENFIVQYLENTAYPLFKNKIKFESRLRDSEAVMGKADREILRTIFDNLLDNARKFGGEETQVTILLTKTGPSISIHVIDDGPGFDPAQHKDLFAAYKRLGMELPGKERKGTGMGLYICQRLARKMGGKLTASSDGPGKGASFTLTLKQ